MGRILVILLTKVSLMEIETDYTNAMFRGGFKVLPTGIWTFDSNHSTHFAEPCWQEKPGRAAR